MNKNASILRAALAGALLICLLPLAQAQWSWKDKDGSRIFSDQPPPNSVPEKDILKRPPGSRAPAAQTAASEATATTPTTTLSASTTALKISGKDSELEKKKKEADAKEAAQKKAETEKITAVKKDNCERAKRAKASFDSGVRISTLNAQGEREVMNDAARAAETKRLQDVMTSECN